MNIRSRTSRIKQSSFLQSLVSAEKRASHASCKPITSNTKIHNYTHFTKYPLSTSKPESTRSTPSYLPAATQTSNFSRTALMADDASYATFLTKANADPSSGTRPDTNKQSTSEARSAYDPSVSDSAVPALLQNLPDIHFTSDTDSAFEPVFFSYASDELPSLEEFKQVLRSAGGEGESVSELTVKQFDPRGEYEEIVRRVERVGREEVGDGNRGNIGEEGKGVKVFRVERGRTRVEYFVLTVGERKLVGLVTKAVES